MTRPNDFVLNTDYLALAQTSREEFTASFGAESYPGGAAVTRQHDFKVKSTPGSVDRILISRNGGDFTVGPSITIPLMTGGFTDGFATIWVYRLDASTVRVRLRIDASQAHTVPAQTIKVKLASFNPPNVF